MTNTQQGGEPDPELELVDDPELAAALRHLGGWGRIHDHPDFVAGRMQVRNDPEGLPRMCRGTDEAAFLAGRAYELYLMKKRPI